jgi:hypothetical protein
MINAFCSVPLNVLLGSVISIATQNGKDTENEVNSTEYLNLLVTYVMTLLDIV